MTVLAIDLGGTKLSFAVLTEQGDILVKKTIALEKRSANQVGDLITDQIRELQQTSDNIQSIGIAVPGIYRHKSGTVWAPNIPGWEDYPLLQQIKDATIIPVVIDSDRAAYILGEVWKGNAKGCSNAIYLAVGTGIGAGILVDGEILRGEHDIAGAIGWMALQQPFKEKYIPCGCFEYHASGAGIVKITLELLANADNYQGALSKAATDTFSAYDVFNAYEQNDVIATEVLNICIRFWGMAISNLVSLFNPEKIILGGGIFGPAVRFIPEITKEAAKWAQPISMKHVSIEASLTGNNAGLYGAGRLAWGRALDRVDR